MNTTKPQTTTQALSVGDIVRKGNGKVDYVVVAVKAYDYVNRFDGQRHQGTQYQVKKVGTKNLKAAGGWCSRRELSLQVR